MMTVEQALAGLNGWHRWGGWAAHHFVDGKQSCNMAHGNFAHGNFNPRPPKSADVAPNGVPYGRVCQRCQKWVAQTRKAER